jgi:hypothetical protein
MMRAFGSFCLFFLALNCLGQAQDAASKAWQMEKEGDAIGARALLQREAQASASDAGAQLAYAAFLDRHRDPESRSYYEQALKLLSRPQDRPQVEAAARRLLVLDLLSGDSAAATRHFEMYKTAGGAGLSVAALQSPKPAPPVATVDIPGPIRSFARMAALSPELNPDDLLSALARNVVTNGYQASSGNESLEPTEYLKLIVRYLSQSRELEKLSGADKIIKIETCDSAQTGDLLRVLGYRMRGGCGSEVVLETVNAMRAFLTIDSGFPLAPLEQALRTNRPFIYDYKPTKVPVIYGADYWLGAKDTKDKGNFIDTFLGDPAVCRLYLGLSKLDPETAEVIKKTIPMPRLRANAHVLDFYGSMFLTRNGEAVVPGGARGVAAWKELTGKSPQDGGAFFERVLTRDDGWLASVYDALARIDGPTRDYLLDPKRVTRFYSAIKGRITSPGPARPVFRANTDMMLLTQRLRIEPDGRPHIPGNLDLWKNLFIHHPQGKYDGKLTKLASSWKEPDDLIEALFALTRKAVENEPLKIYMALTDVNRFRATPLAPETVDRLARDFRTYGSQYSVFAEAPALSDKTIMQYMDVAQGITQIRDQGLRADAAGIVQALTSLWQIFYRQGSIPPAEADATFSAMLGQFEKIHGYRELFDSGRAATRTMLKATGLPANLSTQDGVIDLLAGSAHPADAETHRQVVESMIRIFEAQRLIALDTIFDLADNLESVTKGEKLNSALVAKLAAKINEIQLPRASLSTMEKNALAFGYWTERHVESQRKLNLRVAIEKAGNDAEKLRDVRGHLAPILRDTLVGFNYLHYAPPGAQILMTNPLFVRTHDFLGVQGTNQTWKTTEVFGTGWPSSAGGRLVGSLSGLPYALAEAEQNFLIPSREQALIWGDLVPQMILTAKVARWWTVTPLQLHWVGLHMAEGQSLVAESVLDPAIRKTLLELLGHHAPPARVAKVDELLQEARVRDAIESITPSELFMVAADWWNSNKDEHDVFSSEARKLMTESPGEISYQAISRAFGTPKPTLSNSYQPELLNLRTFPTLMGYSSRIMAESWESNLLYYAALADELHVTPSQMNVLVPEWTQATVEKIFATHLEDWPALLRSLRLVGDDVRMKMRKQMTADQKASLQ